MKKRLKALLMALMMVLSAVGSMVGTYENAYADDEITIRFHYYRADGDYTDWNMWIWPENADGTANEFTGEDEFGKYLDYKVSAGSAKVGFIVRLGEWIEKDPDSDRFVDIADVISGVVDVKLTSGVSEFETDKSGAVTGCKVKSLEATDKHTFMLEFTVVPTVDLNEAVVIKNTVTGEQMSIISPANTVLEEVKANYIIEDGNFGKIPLLILKA